MVGGGGGVKVKRTIENKIIKDQQKDKAKEK